MTRCESENIWTKYEKTKLLVCLFRQSFTITFRLRVFAFFAGRSCYGRGLSDSIRMNTSSRPRNLNFPGRPCCKKQKNSKTKGDCERLPEQTNNQLRFSYSHRVKKILSSNRTKYLLGEKQKRSFASAAHHILLTQQREAKSRAPTKNPPQW